MKRDVEPQIPGINMPPDVSDMDLNGPGGKKRKLEKQLHKAENSKTGYFDNSNKIESILTSSV